MDCRIRFLISLYLQNCDEDLAIQKMPDIRFINEPRLECLLVENIFQFIVAL